MQDLVIDNMAFENGEYFEVAYGGTMAASGDKKIANIKNNPTTTETIPCLLYTSPSPRD